MSLVAFGEDWKATDKDIISAINYAVDNWADIINLSLWWEMYEYSDSYDKVIKKANDKWVIIVAAAGNWDETKDPKIWINTTNDLLSPVCNGDYKYSVIWVWATDKDWNIA
jgi:subtilisin family serine protease